MNFSKKHGLDFLKISRGTQVVHHWFTFFKNYDLKSLTVFQNKKNGRLAI